MANAQLENEGFWRDYAIAMVQQAHGDRSVADAALKDFIARDSKGGEFQVAVLYAIRKEPDQMFKWLDTAYAHARFRPDSARHNTFLPPLSRRPAFHRIVPEAQCASAFNSREAMSERNFFAELKRRNVYKVAVAYAVVGWLLMQNCQPDFSVFRNPKLGGAPRDSPPRHRFSDRAGHRMGI